MGECSGDMMPETGSGWKSTHLLGHSVEWIRGGDPQQTGAFVKEAADAG